MSYQETGGRVVHQKGASGIQFKRKDSAVTPVVVRAEAYKI